MKSLWQSFGGTIVCATTFTFAKDVLSNHSTVLHAVYLAHNCTSTMQQQTATQLVSGNSAKQSTLALVLPCHYQPHTVGLGSLASLWKQRPSMHVCMLCWWYWVKRLRAMGGKPFSGFAGRGLTHWGRVTHICVAYLTIIASDNGLSPSRCQAIIWTNAGILVIRPLGTNFSEIIIKIHTFSFKKMLLKMSSAKRRPFCLGLNVLITVLGLH